MGHKGCCSEGEQSTDSGERWQSHPAPLINQTARSSGVLFWSSERGFNLLAEE